MTTHTKAIITKNQKHIMSYYHASEYGVRTNSEAFIKAVDGYMRHRMMTPYRAIYEMAWGGCYLVYNNDIIRYLESIGLTDERKIENFKNYRNEGPMELYASLLARDGAKLYEQIKAGRNPLAPKKAAAKRTVKRRV